MSRRLRDIQEQIGAYLDSAPLGDLSVLSLCAGQGDDVLGVLSTHPPHRLVGDPQPLRSGERWFSFVD